MTWASEQHHIHPGQSHGHKIRMSKQYDWGCWCDSCVTNGEVADCATARPYCWDVQCPAPICERLVSAARGMAVQVDSPIRLMSPWVVERHSAFQAFQQVERYIPFQKFWFSDVFNLCTSTPGLTYLDVSDCDGADGPG